MLPPRIKTKNLAFLQGFRSTKYKIRTYDPIRVKDVLYHWANFAFLFRPLSGCGEIIHESLTECKPFFIFFARKSAPSLPSPTLVPMHQSLSSRKNNGPNQELLLNCLSCSNINSLSEMKFTLDPQLWASVNRKQNKRFQPFIHRRDYKTPEQEIYYRSRHIH